MGGCVHLFGALDVDALDTWRCIDRHRATDQRDACSGEVRGLCDCEAHLSGAAVADEAYRVDALARRPGGDDDMQALEDARHRDQCDHARSARSSGSSIRPGPNFAAGLVPFARAIDVRCRVHCSVATLACVAALAHIRWFIAGATAIGASVARHNVLSRVIGEARAPGVR